MSDQVAAGMTPLQKMLHPPGSIATDHPWDGHASR
jgi:hypothetical protein